MNHSGMKRLTSSILAAATAFSLMPVMPAGAAAPEYVMMNIPYAAFYAADVNNDVPVDAFSSATKQKTMNTGLAGGSYHVNEDGSAIDGVCFPVKVAQGTDLSAYTEAENADALFCNSDYAYTALAEAPGMYKEVSTAADGTLVFSEIRGQAAAVNADLELTAQTGYGDYQLDVEGLFTTTDREGNVTFEGPLPADTIVYGVILSTKEGNDYGMRHLENIWRKTEIAWCTGFTTNVHNCPTSSAHYVNMMGQTINKVTYLTSAGVYTIAADVYVPVKVGNISVENAKVSAGSTAINMPELPADYAAEYTVEGLNISVADGKLNYKDAEKGSYTLKVTDKNGKYTTMTANFTLLADKLPVVYDAASRSLKAASDASPEAVADYLSSISAVTVNGERFNKNGFHGMPGYVIVKEDGSIDLDIMNGEAKIFQGTADNKCTFEMTVAANTYEDMTFTLVNHKEVKDAQVAATVSKDGKTEGSHCENCGTATKKTAVICKASKISLSKTAYTYDGKVKKPSVVVKDSKGNTISSKYYKVQYASGRKNVGVYKVTVTLTGKYSGTKTLSFKISPKATAVSKVTPASKKLTVEVKKVTAQTTGYQIQYSTSSKFTSAKTVAVKNTTTKKTISSLKANKKYYVRVRTYKTVNGVKYYSAWSAVKSATTKK